MSEKSTREVMREATDKASAQISATIARYLAWLETPEGKAAIAESRARRIDLLDLFKQRNFTAEELNQKYRAAFNGRDSQ